MISILLAGLLAASQAPGSPLPPGQLEMPSDPRWKAADAAMTAAWSRVYGQSKAADLRDTSRGSGPVYSASALGSQRAWLSYRDSQCVAISFMRRDVEDWRAQRSECLIRLTRSRTAELNAMVRK